MTRLKRIGGMGFVLVLLVLGVAADRALAPKTETDRRAKARQEQTDGNFKDALLLYRELALDPDTDPRRVGEDLDGGVACYQKLNRLSEVDAFVEEAIELHRHNWRLLHHAARGYFDAQHHGVIVAAAFQRGPHRGQGRHVNSFARDRARALQVMQQAMQASVDRREVPSGDFYRDLARLLLGHRGQSKAWRLQVLTDLAALPDYDEGYGTRGGRRQGAPVDAEGAPVFHARPASFEASASDGERWRWALARAMTVDPENRTPMLRDYASFLHTQFGVQTMRDYGWFFGRFDTATAADQNPDTATFALHTLNESETMARLATGIARFDLPEDANYLRIFEQIGDHATLAQIFENRRQYARAADLWERAGKPQRVEQIEGNWGQFESTGTHPVGEKPAIQYRFRNGHKVQLVAHKVDVPRLLRDARAYLESNPGSLEWNRVNIGNIGYRLVHENQAQYIGAEVASWDLALQPRPIHFDRRITIETPLQEPGAYLLTARMEDGNISKIVVWVNDTVIVRKPLDGRTYLFLADAATGAALPGMTLDFFGYRRERTDSNKGKKRRYNILTKHFVATTDPEGQCIPAAADMEARHQWLITATNDDGRFAYLGFEGVWYGRRHDAAYNQTKVYMITDRPVYRPGQVVNFKYWIRQAKYDQPDTTVHADQDFAVIIMNPKREKVFEKTFKTDAFAGLNGEFLIPEDAMLGQYYAHVWYKGRSMGGGNFRVEEYKKPEFEVTVEAPTAPIMLGDAIEATIEARYYFGAPVTQGTVKYKVLRTAHDARWFPVADWDWFYGPGYWWFSYDYDWYPGWRRWGCARPSPWWWPARQDPPEVVAEAEVPITADGRVVVRIDTALAKAMHGDTDHRYEITAQVTDRSRRTIVGKGEVLVAREPFKVYTWLNRGHYTVGDVIKFNGLAQTIDRKPVQATGELILYRIGYDDDGSPVEKRIQAWNLDTDDEGGVLLRAKASRAGQYRLAYTVTDKAGHAIEGATIFVIRGQGSDGKAFRFNELELVPDHREYAAGETVKLMINTDRPESTVLYFVRPANGVYLEPEVLRLNGKSHLETLAVTRKDMPNFFVEAVTVSGGRLFTETREIVVPPEKRILNVEVEPSSERYLPGEKATMTVKVTDHHGEPFEGTGAISVYDRAVEYISGGGNTQDIKAFFWKWRRRHNPVTRSTFNRSFSNIVLPKAPSMGHLGVFGHLIADQFGAKEKSGAGLNGVARGRASGSVMRLSKSMAAPASLGMAATEGMVMAAAPMMADAGMDSSGDGGGSSAPATPALRSNFADTAFWHGNLLTDSNGLARVTFTMPDSLTGWKVRTWALGHGTKVGDATADVVTAKNLMLRLQAPRFFVEKDEVMLSANLHNYLEHDKQVRAILEVDGGCLEILPGADGETAHADMASVVVVPVVADGEHRVDWRVKVIREGEATIRMKALTDEESDAVEMRFPVFVHGMLKTESFSTVVRRDAASATLDVRVPAQRRLDASRLEVRFSPTLAGAMVDALPYLAEYPYGCTEQTLSRFLPSVITQEVLREMGIDLAAIRETRTNLNAQELGDDRERAAQWKRWDRNPVFDAQTLDDMVATGLRRLASMQLSDGGWGWFSGWGERSTPHTTAHVVRGLQVARENDVAVDDDMLVRGVSWLRKYQDNECAKLRNAPQRKEPWKLHADNLDALVYMVLQDADQRDSEMDEFLFRDRTLLAVYGKALYAMALHNQQQIDKRDQLIRNIEQFLVEDDENQTAYLNLPNSGYWWYWYGSEYEAHAYYLKLLALTAPQSDRAAGLVKYLLNNRKHATYWKSTRDTAICIEAMADYLRASGEDKPDMTVEILLDGVKRKEARITADNLFTFDNTFVLEGDAVTTGTHALEIRRQGEGPVYANAYLTVFTLEDPIRRAGLEIRVNRTFYKLVPADKQIKVSGAHGQALDQKVEIYVREPITNLQALVSGDLVEVELEIESKNDYEYIVFEDMKAAGFEPVDLRSGYNANDLGAYMELRDEKVCFFVRQLARGRHSMSYRLRAEIPGKFSALPTKAYAMYAPELRANSDELKVRIEDAR